MIEKLWYQDNEVLVYRFEYQYDSLNRIKIARDYPQGDLFDTTIYYEQSELFYDVSDSNSIVKANN